MTSDKKILITLGDIGGIGPEIVLKALNSFNVKGIIVIGNGEAFYKTAFELDLPMPQNIEIVDIPFDYSKIKIGEPTPESGKHSMASLVKACDLTKEGKARAIVTAPISKKSINMAGFNFTGQTEILKKYLKESRIKRVLDSFNQSNKSNGPEMLFVADNLRVMLLTRHIKIGEVSQNLKTDNILASILTLNNSLEKDFNVSNPKIALCALNPHGGENGILGLEEEYFLIPAINQLREKHSINIEGPFPSDTLWAKTAKSCLSGEKPYYDAYVACYHDQGLIPIKMLAMDTAVNVTINLPVIRTSPCHGTAYDIAGMNIADHRSMVEAIKLAESISSVKVC